jgi:7,8-dihydropterin-6-yl-methyl-4-(beta-D-ribofuranosyl)aminobenzene 5'-phosphate synthase
MHCSGFAAKTALEAALGEGCVPAGVGHKVIISGVPDDDSNLRPPGIHSR